MSAFTIFSGIVSFYRYLHLDSNYKSVVQISHQQYHFIYLSYFPLYKFSFYSHNICIYCNQSTSITNTCRPVMLLCWQFCFILVFSTIKNVETVYTVGGEQEVMSVNVAMFLSVVIVYSLRINSQ